MPVSNDDLKYIIDDPVAYMQLSNEKIDPKGTTDSTTHHEGML